MWQEEVDLTDPIQRRYLVIAQFSPTNRLRGDACMYGPRRKLLACNAAHRHHCAGLYLRARRKRCFRTQPATITQFDRTCDKSKLRIAPVMAARAEIRAL